jgi:hypothetical protein
VRAIADGAARPAVTSKIAMLSNNFFMIVSFYAVASGY